MNYYISHLKLGAILQYTHACPPATTFPLSVCNAETSHLEYEWIEV